MHALRGDPIEVGLCHPGALERVEEPIAAVCAEARLERDTKRAVGVVQHRWVRGEQALARLHADPFGETRRHRREPGLVAVFVGPNRAQHGVDIVAEAGLLPNHVQPRVGRVVHPGDPILVEVPPAERHTPKNHGFASAVHDTRAVGPEAGAPLPRRRRAFRGRGGAGEQGESHGGPGAGFAP